jgi:asparagine synthase (glutamine-hydrolysing)
MCGFFTIFDKDFKLSKARAALKLLVHRGPNGTAEYTTKNHYMGHTRLSIIDLSDAAQQPFVSEDNLVSVVVNGEIYNYLSLRYELIKLGYEFSSNSDCEVVLAGYLKWGIDGLLQKIRGMFAFTIHDTEAAKIFAVRDHLGVKPLFYHVGQNRMSTASELSAIVEYLELSPTKHYDYTALYDFLTYSYVPAPKTPFTAIKKLEPGHYLQFDVENNELQINQYWDIEFQNILNHSEEVAVSNIQKLLVASVTEELQADVEVGLFLSGGLDSSAVALLASRISGEKIRAFSLFFENPIYDESSRIEDCVDFLKLKHEHFTVTEGLAKKVFASQLSHFNEPFGDTSFIPTNIVSEVASKHVKVVLTGDGGDEVFGGYTRYEFFEKRPYQRLKLPRVLNNILNSNILNRLKFVKKLVNRIQLYFTFDDFEVYTRFMGGLIHSEKNIYRKRWKIPNDYDDYWYYRKYYKSELPVVKRFQYLDLKTYLPDDNLTKVDRMSMRHGIEARVPLLNLNLIEYLFRLPSNIVYDSKNPKHLLKKALGKNLPESILKGSKRGFSIPSHDWFVKDSDFRNLNELIINMFLKKN